MASMRLVFSSYSVGMFVHMEVPNTFHLFIKFKKKDEGPSVWLLI